MSKSQEKNKKLICRRDLVINEADGCEHYNDMWCKKDGKECEFNWYYLNEKEPRERFIGMLKALVIYDAVACSGYDGSGDTWIEIEKDENGELIKLKDIEVIIKALK